MIFLHCHSNLQVVQNMSCHLFMELSKHLSLLCFIVLWGVYSELILSKCSLLQLHFLVYIVLHVKFIILTSLFNSQK
jgi:hypothetical protein